MFPQDIATAYVNLAIVTPFAIYASTKVLVDVNYLPKHVIYCVESKDVQESAFTFADHATIYAASFSAAQYALSISDSGLGKTEMLLGLVPGEQVMPLCFLRVNMKSSGIFFSL